MEPLEIEQRIRATQHIVRARAESGEDFALLRDTLIPFIEQSLESMTKEEIFEDLKRICARYDRAVLDMREQHRLFDTERKNLERELELSADRTAQAKMETGARLAEQKADYERMMAEREAEFERRMAEKEADHKRVMAEKEAEIASLRESLTDSRHVEESLKQDRFAGKSKRGIDSKTCTRKGRDDDKDDFDGTSGSAPPTDVDVASTADSAEDVPTSAGVSGTRDRTMDLDEFRRSSAKRPSHYTLADAKEKVTHECDLSQLPEGAVVVGKMKKEVVFHEVHTVRADIYDFVTYRIQESVTDGDGNELKVWREHTVHFPKKSGDGTQTATPCMRGRLPGQVPGTHVNPDLAANLLVLHYDCNVPMNRLSKVYREYGLSIGRSTLENIDSKAASLLKPVYEKLTEDILGDGSVVFCDETWHRLHLPDGTRKVYDWILANRKEKAVVYAYDNGSRGRKVIASLLEGHDVKAVHTDGYNAYYFLPEAGIVHICCGAHVWRKLKEWYERTSDPEAKALLLDLAELYMMEARLREAKASPEKVTATRNSPEVTGIITRFKARVELLLQKAAVIPRIGLRALNYAKEMADKVFRWREDADYELDNNFAEQSARPVATSRKTSLFHCSHRGAENDCIIRSLLETCRLRGVSKLGWLKAFFKAVAAGRTDYDRMLPGILPVE